MTQLPTLGEEQAVQKSGVALPLVEAQSTPQGFLRTVSESDMWLKLPTSGLSVDNLTDCEGGDLLSFLCDEHVRLSVVTQVLSSAE
jgi:hypothetical protein